MKYRPNKDFLNISKLVTQNLLLGRKSKKNVEPLITEEQPKLEFSENVELIQFNSDESNRIEIKKSAEVQLVKTGTVSWLNIYGLGFTKSLDEIIKFNELDSFLTNLFSDVSHRTKVVPLNGCFFFTAKSVYSSDQEDLILEQIMFVVSDHFVWSLQEKAGDNFDHIRERIERKVGIVRNQKSDYLLFLLLESIVDNYYLTYESMREEMKIVLESKLDQALPNHLEIIEVKKAHLFRMRRSIGNLREALNQIPNIDPTIIKGESHKYFSELKEQCAYLGDLIDNDLTRLESAANLFFSLQSHKLNEVMKTLTILSVIFIPLTFIAGIYGMNFENMPELGFKYGYFITVGVMILVAITSIIFFRRRRWF